MLVTLEDFCVDTHNGHVGTIHVYVHMYIESLLTVHITQDEGVPHLLQSVVA